MYVLLKPWHNNVQVSSSSSSQWLCTTHESARLSTENLEQRKNLCTNTVPSCPFDIYPPFIRILDFYVRKKPGEDGSCHYYTCIHTWIRGLFLCEHKGMRIRTRGYLLRWKSAVTNAKFSYDKYCFTETT